MGVVDAGFGVFLCQSIETKATAIFSSVYRKKLLSASTSDFVHSGKGARCKVNDSGILKPFPILSMQPNDTLDALLACKKYCADNEHCWGCSIQGSTSYKMNAINDCYKKETWSGLIEGEVSQKPSCFHVNVKTSSEKLISWSLGTCFGSQEYKRDTLYISRCCLLPGKYTLECKNENRAVGWSHGFIEFQGLRYCDDFTGLKALRTVEISMITSPESSLTESKNKGNQTITKSTFIS